MKTKTLLSVICAALATSCLNAPNLSAQSPEIPPVPAPSPGSIAIETGPAAQITMDDGTGVAMRIRGRRARRVLLRAGHTSTVVLQYTPAYAGLIVEAVAMDGGKVRFPGNRNAVTPGGSVVLQFSDARDPGLYRIAVNCGGVASTLQFWIADPADPAIDASVLVPQS